MHLNLNLVNCVLGYCVCYLISLKLNNPIVRLRQGEPCTSSCGVSSWHHSSAHQRTPRKGRGFHLAQQYSTHPQGGRGTVVTCQLKLQPSIFLILLISHEFFISLSFLFISVICKESRIPIFVMLIKI